MSERLQALIADYYTFDNNLTYEVKEILSPPNRSHIVASVIYYPSDTSDNAPFTLSAIMCECEFTEGVGWSRSAKRDIPTFCGARDAAIDTLHKQLHDRFITGSRLRGTYQNPLQPYLPNVVDSLARRVIDHRPIERLADAQLLDGYFFVQTLYSITGIEVSAIVASLRRMEERKCLRVVEVTTDLLPSAIGELLVAPYETDPPSKS